MMVSLVLLQEVFGVMVSLVLFICGLWGDGFTGPFYAGNVLVLFCV